MTSGMSSPIEALNSKAPNFNFSKINSDVMTLKQCQAYIAQYFVPLKDGNHIVFEDGQYILRDKDTIKNVYFNRIPLYELDIGDGNVKSLDLSKWYFTKYTGMRSITHELNKPVFFDDKINMCPQFIHTYQKYETLSDSTKAKVNIMLNYVNEVLANKQNDAYIYLLQWLSYMTKGNKNDSILYLKSKQGYGKSTLLEFMRDHVLGNKLSQETGSQPLLSNFNAILGGKLFVYFEELETFSTAQWMACSSKLKRYATSETIVIEDKHMKPYTTKNIMNVVVASNNDAIMDDDGRRYFILDVSPHRQVIPNCNTPRNEENRKFWDAIRTCFNTEVGHAFYCYLMEIDTSNYRPQNFPTTQSKLDSYAKRLETHENFLKYHYVLNRQGLLTNVGDLYSEYTEYCRSNGIVKLISKIDFNKKLKEIGIESYKSNKEANKIKVSSDELQEIAKCRHWIHETDEYYDESKESVKTKPSDLDYGLTENPEITIENLQKDLREEQKQKTEYQIECDKLKAELEELKKKYEMPIPILERSENLEVNFLDELEAAPVKEPKSKGTKGVMEKMKQKLSE